jgi:hypothetical protein
MSRPSRFLHTSLAAAALAVGGTFLDASQPRPSYSAEQIRITTTGPLVVTISVDSLETLAETGEVTDELNSMPASWETVCCSNCRRRCPLNFPWTWSQWIT